MSPRAIWKGYLKVADLTCAVRLYAATSTSDRIALHMINRATGNRLKRQFVDADSGVAVDRDDQVKGYEVSDGDYILLDPAEIAAVVPDSDKTLTVQAFVTCDDIDAVYFDKPYFLAPADRSADEAFSLMREGMRVSRVAAIAQTVLFRRLRTVLIRPEGPGMIATTLSFDYEIRSAATAFEDIPQMNIKGEMLDLAQHIIKTKAGKFDPLIFDDRYDNALADLVKAKLEGKKIVPRAEAEPMKVVDLLAALRESAGGAGPSAKAAPLPAAGAMKRQTG